jgi:hypothetical protein
LVKLDLDTLLDLFEAAGIAVTDEQALDCLQSLPCNLLGRHSVHDVIVWLRRFTINASSPQKRLPLWRRELFQYREQLLGWVDWFQLWLEKINSQERAAQEVQRCHRKRIQEQKMATQSEESDDSSPAVLLASSSNQKKFQKSSAFENIIKGSIRLSGWQRHRQMSRPTKCGLLASFGPPSIIHAASSAAPKKGSTTNSVLKSKTEPKPQHRGRVSVEFFTKPEGKKREQLVGNDGIVKDFGSLTPGDFLHYFDKVGYVVELSEAELASQAAYAAARAAGLTMSGASAPAGGAKPSNFLAWIVFPVADTATSQEAFCLLKTATNFFESIPLDYRHELYTTTKGHLFYLEPKSNHLTPVPQPHSTSSTGPQHPRVVCVALLHDRDPYKAIEDQIKSLTLFFTRALRMLKIDLRLVKSLSELYDESAEYDHFQEKLFGPQEDELGEEGMNPLRFAKMCRKRQLAAQEAIEKAPTMPLEELKLHLSTRGLSTRGTKEELITRAQDAFKRQAELIGFGEMSEFGAQLVKRIFDMFDEDKDGALSLMEMNRFLLATGAEAFYDTKAYKSMMLEEGFLLDSHYRLTLEGLTAYYERYGRLARDINQLGLGSLSHLGQGEVEVRLEYESDAIHSLYSILEPNTLTQRTLKHILGVISSSSEFFLGGSFPHLENLFTLLKCDSLPYAQTLFEGIKRPGWVSHLIHSWCEWFADGEEGLIPSLRANSKAKFNNFSQFTKQFKKFSTPAEEMHQRGEEDESTDSADEPSQGGVFTAPLSGVNEIDSCLSDSSLRRQYVSMFQIFYKNNKVKPITSSSAEGDEEDEKERCLPLEPKHAEVNRWIEHLDALLPPIIAYSSQKTLMNDEINELLTAAANIYNRLSGHERLTRSERDRLQILKLKCERRAEKLIGQLEESVHLCGAHFLSFYDALRLYGDKTAGISQIGCGTNEMGFKLNLDGMDWLHYLPEGMGELSTVKQKESDKYERAMQRKNAALNAIERERLRRDLDEEEREKRRLWEIANAQLARDEEEKGLFEELYSLLLESREERLPSQEVDEMITAWKRLLQKREARYPNSMKVAVCQNDLACVIFEVCGDHPILRAEAVSYLRSSAEISMKRLEAILQREVTPSLIPPMTPFSDRDHGGVG